MDWTKKYKKAVTFSYDDGNEQDQRLAALFGKYRVKAAFNLNSGMDESTGTWVCEGLAVRHLNPRQWPTVYKGQECAVHTVHHPNLYEMEDSDRIRMEIREDKAAIERIVGQQVYGMAYPFGGHTKNVRQIAAKEGIYYARTTVSSYGFDMPERLLELPPTCHHDDPALFELAEEFIRRNDGRYQIFYIWGHSYEFDVHENWERFERFLKMVSGRKDVYYGTNSQVLRPCWEMGVKV